MNATKAFVGGVLGGAVMSAIMFMARTVMGMNVHLEMTLGTMFGGPPTMTKTLIGLMMHLMISGGIALIYAAGFEQLKRAGAGTGAAFGVVHTLVAGVFMGYVLPVMHPLVTEQMAGPGPFMANLGLLGVVAFVMLHIIFGAIVGKVYEPAPRMATT